MLEGSLWDKILIVALPFAFTGIMQQLFNAADIAMLGQFVGKEAMAAVGSNSPIIAMVLSLFIGVSLGANVVIARFIGKKNIHGVHAAVHTAILVALGSGVVMTILGEIAAAPLLRALSVPDEIFDMSVLYLRIFLLGMPVILLYNFESSIFRSQGDTRTPLYCLIVSGVVKFFLNLYFYPRPRHVCRRRGHRHSRCQYDQFGTALLFPVPQHDGYPRPFAGFPRR